MEICNELTVEKLMEILNKMNPESVVKICNYEGCMSNVHEVICDRWSEEDVCIISEMYSDTRELSYEFEDPEVVYCGEE